MARLSLKHSHAGFFSGSCLWRGPVLLPSKAMFLVQFEQQNLTGIRVTALCTRHTVLRLHNIQIDKIAILSYSTTILPRFSKNFIATVPPYFRFYHNFCYSGLLPFLPRQIFASVCTRVLIFSWYLANKILRLLKVIKVKCDLWQVEGGKTDFLIVKSMRIKRRRQLSWMLQTTGLITLCNDEFW